MVAVGEVVGVIVAVPGGDEIRIHVPLPVPAMVTDPPGSDTQLAVWSGPALAVVVMITFTVSLQLPAPHV